jgi:hypothetical protein
MDIAIIRRPGDSTSNAPPEAPTVPLPDAVRAERVAAQQRYDAFAAGGDADPSAQCALSSDPRSDFDHCDARTTEHPVLFARQATDTNEVESQDVHQGALGDCHLMSVLLAMARSPEGRALIHNAIRENRNDHGEVVSYTVTLHRPQTHWFGLGRTTFTDVQVTVTRQFERGHAEARFAGNADEVWPLVMEKAYAQLCGGYDALAQGGQPSDAMQVLTGRPATHTDFGWFTSYREDELARDLAAGSMVILSSRRGIDGYGLSEHHSYVVTGTVERGGKLCVLMNNPWGSRDPEPVPVAELDRCFRAVSVGSVR